MPQYQRDRCIVSGRSGTVYIEWLVALAVSFSITFVVADSVFDTFFPALGRMTGLLRNVVLLLLLFYQIGHGGIKVRGRRVFLFFIVYSFYILLYTTVFSVYKAADLVKAPSSVLNFFYRTGQILIYLFCADTIVKYIKPAKFLIISFFVAIIPAVFFISYIGVDTLQVFGQDKNGDDYISAMLLGYANAPIIAVSVLFYSRLFKSRALSRLFASTIIILSGFVLVAGGERGPILWTIVNICICFFLTHKNVAKYVLIALGLGLLLLVNYNSIMAKLEEIAPRTAEKISSTVEEGDTNGRFDLNDPEGSTYIIGLRQFASSPLFGSYFRLKTNHWIFRGHYPHNVFIEFMITMGLMGLIPFLFLLWRSWKNARRIKFSDNKDGQLFCLALFLAIFLQLQTSETIVFNSTFWLFLYIICNLDKFNTATIKKTIVAY